MTNVSNEKYIHLKTMWDSIEDIVDKKTKRLFA